MSADHLALDTADEVVELLRFEDIHLVCDHISTMVTIMVLVNDITHCCLTVRVITYSQNKFSLHFFTWLDGTNFLILRI